MFLLGQMTLRKWAGVLVVVLAVVVGGTWLAVKTTTDHLLYQDATSTAHDWARFLAENVTDLEQIASGETPSAASMAFFEAARKSRQVFRYTIFNRYGYSQLVSDRQSIAFVELSEYSADAVRAISADRPVVDVKESDSTDLPELYAEAYVAVRVAGEPVAIVAAYVDQTAQADTFYRTFLLAAAALCLLTGISFAAPAMAWYRRTQQKQMADRRIRFLAHHDALTSLINRGYLIERLDRMLAALPPDGRMIAVHFLDLDHFKEVNDMLGHDGGDFLLMTVAERLSNATRREDLVSRLGGDEFVIVQVDLADRRGAEEYAARLAAALAAPIHFGEHEIATTVSIGIALAPADGATSERLLKSADLALYKSKADGRNCVRFFTPDLDQALQSRLRLERILREAASSNGFLVHYQPVFEMSGRHLIGFEALLRLPDPDGSLIQAADFIPVAEEMRLIGKLGEWVLHEACKTATTWPEPLTVAVNLSPSQFEMGSVSAIVEDALKVSGLAPHRLELEITETLLLGRTAAVLDELRKIKQLGVAIVMDDFGTGYSSLSYLWQFPFDKIKIDHSFMQGLGSSRQEAETVVKTIIALGRELRMRVTVEGVETASQVDFLYDADADQVQGFYFGHPVPAAEIAAKLLANFRKGRPGEQAQDAGRVGQSKAAAAAG